MRRKRPYHHGNLKDALLEAAIQLIAEAGLAGFTLREVARRAGVSHNAPYRHFRDKDELLAAVAAEGFRELNQAMLDAAASQPTALDRLKRSGWAYVSFALRRPQHFTVMFDAPAVEGGDSKYAQAGEQAFGTLVSFIEECQSAGQLPPGDSLDRALTAWSLVHGIAKLAVSGRLPYRSTAEVLEFAGFALSGALLPAPGTTAPASAGSTTNSSCRAGRGRAPVARA
jgi:AcrR family transcriptional regulator